jgi:phosphoglycolate phosphatase
VSDVPSRPVGARRSPFELAIFDLDGTLCDSVPDIAWALNRTLEEAGHPAQAVDVVRGMVGDGARQLIARALGRSAAPGAGAADAAPGEDHPSAPPRIGHWLGRFIEHYQGHVAVATRVYPGMAELLERLSGVPGLVLSVLTNKPKPIATQLLDALGIARHFAVVLGDGDGFPNKPDPAAAEALIRGRGTTVERAVVIGDGLPDVRMARAVGCSAISVTWGYVAEELLRAELPRWVVSSPAELEPLLLT